MGDMSAMSSIDRVLAAHSDEIIADLREENPSSLIRSFNLSNAVYRIEITATLVDDSFLTLASIDIDSLAERYPDCEVGY